MKMNARAADDIFQFLRAIVFCITQPPASVLADPSMLCYNRS